MKTQIYREVSMGRKKRETSDSVLGIVLQRLMRERRLSQTELAHAIGKGVGVLNGWLYGRQPYSIKDVITLANYFGLHRDDLELGTSQDRAQKAEIERLKAEKEKLENELEISQLNILSYIETIDELKGKVG